MFEPIPRFLVSHTVLEGHDQLTLISFGRVYPGCVSVAGTDINWRVLLSGSFNLSMSMLLRMFIQTKPHFMICSEKNEELKFDLKFKPSDCPGVKLKFHSLIQVSRKGNILAYWD